MIRDRDSTASLSGSRVHALDDLRVQNAVTRQVDAVPEINLEDDALAPTLLGEHEDDQWNAGELRLEPGSTKNEQGSVFPFAFHPRLAQVLREQRERVEGIQRERDFLIASVFVHDTGEAMSGWYYDSWRTACEKASLAGRIVHDFRRSAARNLVRAGVPESVAMKLTGHKTRSIFDRYNVTSSTDLREAVKKLARFHTQAGTETGRVIAMTRNRRAK